MSRSFKNKIRESIYYKSTRDYNNRQDDTKYRHVRYRAKHKNIGNFITKAILKRISQYDLC